MKLEDALMVANEVLATLKPFANRIEIVGSIRRKRRIVNDIDILIEPLNTFGLGEAIAGLLGLTSRGDKIQRGTYKGIQIDVYFADTNTWDTLKLIRTGSAGHNIRLTSLAKRRGWHLYADGRGLMNDKGKIVARSEEEIFNALSITYLLPESRDPEVYQGLWRTKPPPRKIPND